MLDISKISGALSMLYTDDIYLFEPNPTKDGTYGSVMEGWKDPVHVMGNAQTYSGDLAFKEYGIQKSCEKRVFLPTDTTVSEGWGVSFSSAATKPELYVKWAPQNKTHRFILAGTR
jgi:hypothetical protein